MRKVDFLFIYEVKLREIESVCLLKFELERRGYKVAIQNSWDCIFNNPPKFRTNVLVTSACYNTETLKLFTEHVKSFKNVVNLQWEQITSPEQAENRNTVWFFNGLAHKVTHLSWGEKNRKRLVEFCGLPQENVKTTGCVSFDFFKKPLINFYLSRKELLKRHEIDADNIICLFISSFSLSNLPEGVSDTLREAVNVDEAIPVAELSQKLILEWFSRALENHPDITFVYRPHPTENNSPLLREMELRHKRFRVISAHSIRQWILTCDTIYNWFSTSVAEIRAAQKSYFTLRPVEMKKENDVIVFDDVHFVSTFDEFESTLYVKNATFPIAQEVMDEYYGKLSDEMAYQKIADVLCAVEKRRKSTFTKKEIKLLLHGAVPKQIDFFRDASGILRKKMPFSAKLDKLYIYLYTTINSSFIGRGINMLALETDIKLPILERRRSFLKQATQNSIQEMTDKQKEQQRYYRSMTQKNACSDEEMMLISEKIAKCFK